MSHQRIDLISKPERSFSRFNAKSIIQKIPTKSPCRASTDFRVEILAAVFEKIYTLQKFVSKNAKHPVA